MVSAETREILIALADKYEVADFSMGDPSRVLSRYGDEKDVECAAFLMAVLSFGRREQFLPKAEWLLSLSGGEVARWIKDGYPCFPSGADKFYRFYSYDDIIDVLDVLKNALDEHGSFSNAVRFSRECYRKDSGIYDDVAAVIGRMFSRCRAVSHTKMSANKRTRMFLRWMVRRDSPVDIGIWTWLEPRDLIIPLDTHVLHCAKRLGLIAPNARPTDKTARELTRVLQEVWPHDPCKGDFALFGWGIEEGSASNH